MDRNEEITNVAEQHGVNTIREELLKDLSEDTIKLIDDLMITNFEYGAEWADNNPKSHYNTSNIDYLHTIFESIERIASKTTSGNVAHNANEIKLLARCALKTFNKNL